MNASICKLLGLGLIFGPLQGLQAQNSKNVSFHRPLNSSFTLHVQVTEYEKKHYNRKIPLVKYSPKGIDGVFFYGNPPDCINSRGTTNNGHVYFTPSCEASSVVLNITFRDSTGAYCVIELLEELNIDLTNSVRDYTLPISTIRCDDKRELEQVRNDSVFYASKGTLNDVFEIKHLYKRMTESMQRVEHWGKVSRFRPDNQMALDSLKEAEKALANIQLETDTAFMLFNKFGQEAIYHAFNVPARSYEVANANLQIRRGNVFQGYSDLMEFVGNAGYQELSKEAKWELLCRGFNLANLFDDDLGIKKIRKLVIAAGFGSFLLLVAKSLLPGRKANGEEQVPRGSESPKEEDQENQSPDKKKVPLDLIEPKNQFPKMKREMRKNQRQADSLRRSYILVYNPLAIPGGSLDSNIIFSAQQDGLLFRTQTQVLDSNYTTAKRATPYFGFMNDKKNFRTEVKCNFNNHKVDLLDPIIGLTTDSIEWNTVGLSLTFGLNLIDRKIKKSKDGRMIFFADTRTSLEFVFNKGKTITFLENGPNPSLDEVSSLGEKSTGGRVGGGFSGKTFLLYFTTEYAIDIFGRNSINSLIGNKGQLALGIELGIRISSFSPASSSGDSRRRSITYLY